MIFLRAAEMERGFGAIENWRTETESLGEGGARDNRDEGFNKTRANSHGEVRASEARSGLLPFVLRTVLGRGGAGVPVWCPVWVRTGNQHRMARLGEASSPGSWARARAHTRSRSSPAACAGFLLEVPERSFDRFREESK